MKSLKKIQENLNLVEVKKDGETLKNRVIKKLGLKNFKIEFDDVNCYGVIYTYAIIKTAKSVLKFRYKSTYNKNVIELPKELI